MNKLRHCCSLARSSQQTNRCALQDDWDSIQNKLMDADVLVLGVPTYFSGALGINALTHLFLERWFALRHLGVKLKKVVLALASATGAVEPVINNLKLPALSKQPDVINQARVIAANII